MATFGCVCIFIVLMCTFFVCETYAATSVSGTTTKKEETVKVELVKGSAIITVSDADSWVFAQVQSTGGDKIGEALGGEKLLAPLGQEKSFVAPVKKAGTYYLYLHGTNAGAKYSITTVKSGGTLKNGTPKLGTSYGDNKSVVWYTVKVAKSGSLRITVNDSSYHYPGYSKVRLKKDGTLISGEEYLIQGLRYSTVYGVTKGTYKVGVRSSSELYKITLNLNELKIAKCGGDKSSAAPIKAKAKAYGVIQPGDPLESWYSVEIPVRKKEGEQHTITVSATNNNVVTTGGILVKLRYKKKVNGKEVTQKKSYLLNNSKQDIAFKAYKTKTRKVYVCVVGAEGASGTYKVTWK